MPKQIRPLIPFLIIVSLTYFLSGEKVFERFTPREVCMYYNQKLVLLHAVSDTVIFFSYIVLGFLLWRLYSYLKVKGFPFSQYAWQFGGFIFFCGITHLISVINLKVTYYWIDGIAKLLTAWFSFLVMIAFFREYPNLKAMKTPAEFEDLANKLNELLKEIKAKETKK